MRANAADGCWKGNLLFDYIECLFMTALGDEFDITADIHTGRTGCLTGRKEEPR
jgi:hypothetical protein